MPLLTALPIDGTMPGISRRTSSATFDWRSSISSDVVTMTGVARTRFGFLISEPVTVISRSPSGFGAASAGAPGVALPAAGVPGVTCAKAGTAKATAPTSMVERSSTVLSDSGIEESP